MIQIDGPTKVVQIRVALLEEQVAALTLLLIEFKELFAWEPSDMSVSAKTSSPLS